MALNYLIRRAGAGAGRGGPVTGWGGGLASPLLPPSAATSQTPTSLPSNRDAGSLPFRFRHLGVGAGHNVPRPFLSETQTSPVAVAGGASALAAFALGAGLARRFPTPPAPAPEGSI